MGLVDRLRAIFRRSPPAAPPALPPAAGEPWTIPVVAAAVQQVASATSRADYDAGLATIAAAAAEVSKAKGSVTDPVGRPGFDVAGGYLTSRESSADLNGSAKWTTYANNVRNVALVGAGVRRFLELVGAPTWRVPPSDPDDADAVFMAEFAANQIRNLATPWRVVVQTAAMARFNGCAIQAWTARKLKGGEYDGMIGLADIADRPMHTIERWLTDDEKNVLGVVQRDPTTSVEFTIDRGRMLWSRDVPLTDNPLGVGIYRHLAEPVRELNELRRISRQGFETDLAGIPVIYAPVAALRDKIGKPAYPSGPIFTATDFQNALRGVLTFAENHVRTKETGLVFDSGSYPNADKSPSGTPLYKFELAQAGGQAHEPVLNAQHDVRWEIAILIGCADLLVGAGGEGSLAMAKVKTADAYRLITGALNCVAETIQRDAFRPLWAMNGRDPALAPLPTWNKLELYDVVEALAGVLNPLSAAGITLDRSEPGDLELANAALTHVGLPPLPMIEEEPIGPLDEATARRYGLGGKDAKDNPDGVTVDEGDGDDLEDDDTDEPPAAPAKKRK